MNLNIEENKLDISFNDNAMKIAPEKNNRDISIENSNVDINFGNQEENIDFDTGKILEKDHSKLENLDYEHSGHTGFAPAGNYVEDENYVHTDNNYTNKDKEKLYNLKAHDIPYDDNYGYGTDNVQDALDEVYNIFDNMPAFDTSGDGDMYLSDDGTYKPITSGDIRIPNINIKCIVKDGEKYLRLIFGAYSKAFENYVIDNGIQIHLLRYKNCARRVWNDQMKTKEKKWTHPANKPIWSEPDKQCWGLACYQQFMSQDDYVGQLESADYYIANNGMVQSEYDLTYDDFKKGYLDINVRDLMSCIVKKGGFVGFEDIDMHIPYEEDGELVKIMGTRTSPRRKRVRQPIKYVFALPIITSKGKLKYQYGVSNEAILELMTLRDQQAMTGYAEGDKLLSDIGFGVLIK